MRRANLFHVVFELLVAAFFREPSLADLQHTPLSYWGLHAIFAGTLFHLFGGFIRRGIERHARERKRIRG